MGLVAGIDFGTSGARCIVIDQESRIRFETSRPFPAYASLDNLAAIWQQSLFFLIRDIPAHLKAEIQRLAIDATSSTVLLCDQRGLPITIPLLYNDDRAKEVLPIVQGIAPADHVVLSATSSLCKLFWFLRHIPHPEDTHFLHQADWLAFLLHRQIGITDYHNALKLGYDVANLAYPDWLLSQPLPVRLPEVKPPGTAIAPVAANLAKRFGLSPDCIVCTGTTDSNAAFLASRASTPGEAVTSLGSTLVVKLLSQTPVNNSSYGIYSHRLGDLWLVGGASNAGGAVLRRYFSDEELELLSEKIDPAVASPLQYYPLLKPGDRFPINDPDLPPRLEPVPDDRIDFLHGILESLARIEAKGYQLLQELGASPLKCVYSAGGGAQNLIWQKIRHRHLGVAMAESQNTEAAYGAALLAKTSLSH